MGRRCTPNTERVVMARNSCRLHSIIVGLLADGFVQLHAFFVLISVSISACIMIEEERLLSQVE